ncbi:hypothetical protein [Brachyspira hyodysenteriae]|uniref:hypothetical protein n=1 Tax=Brachyspira hyodysenteriae TaxID=159 RepID=UPI0022CDA8AE|nr:hypothetical protein [Brachyspira hyodysenteriae]MCZ9874371.1 hypothetical protein [Brachyspira hyodysenteriae]
MSQTSVQEKKTIRYGSAKVLIGDRFDKLIDIGAGRSVSYKRNYVYNRYRKRQCRNYSYSTDRA